MLSFRTTALGGVLFFVGAVRSGGISICVVVLNETGSVVSGIALVPNGGIAFFLLLLFRTKTGRWDCWFYRVPVALCHSSIFKYLVLQVLFRTKQAGGILDDIVALPGRLTLRHVFSFCVLEWGVLYN